VAVVDVAERVSNRKCVKHLPLKASKALWLIPPSKKVAAGMVVEAPAALPDPSELDAWAHWMVIASSLAAPQRLSDGLVTGVCRQSTPAVGVSRWRPPAPLFRLVSQL